MNKIIDALKLAEEANAKHEPLCEDEGCPHHGTPHICFSDPSVLDKPFACETGECPDKSLCAGACECLYKAQPVKQEPVGVVEPSEEWGVAGVLIAGLPIGTKLYAAPVSAKREWVDLTEGEQESIYLKCNTPSEYINAAIAAFKEKNT